MVAVNRLTGHSPGFFSVYTLPPNQAASVAAQQKINTQRQQIPTRRDVPALILRKSRALLADCALHLPSRAVAHRLVTGPAAATAALPSASVDLVVTSPPFLDVVNYAGDNWLRCWFCDVDPEAVQLTVVRRIADWRREMTAVFGELARVLRPGGHVAFEVGEVRSGKVRLEEHVVPCGVAAGLTPRLLLINAQQFTKTARAGAWTTTPRAPTPTGSCCSRSADTPRTHASLRFRIRSRGLTLLDVLVDAAEGVTFPEE